MVVTSHQPTVFVVQMHAIPFAIPEHGTVGTDSLASPFPMTKHFETMVPDFHEIILVDIPLVVIGSDAGTTGYGSVDANGSDRYAGMAAEKIIAHFCFIGT